MTTLNYFAIPVDKIQQPPPHLWYAGWSSVRPTMGTNTQVVGAKPEPPPFVIGATTGALPAKAMLIGKGQRSQFPPPPPFPFLGTTAAAYFSSIQGWLASGTDTQLCSYFSIPFTEVPVQPTYTRWFATWSPVRPVFEAGWLAPLAIGATPGAVPDGGKFIIALDKDPIPPPPLAAPEMDLDSYKAYLKDRGA